MGRYLSFGYYCYGCCTTHSDGISRWVPDKNCTRYNDRLCSEIGRDTETDLGERAANHYIANVTACHFMYTYLAGILQTTEAYSNQTHCGVGKAAFVVLG